MGARLYEVAFNWDYYGRFPGRSPLCGRAASRCTAASSSASSPAWCSPSTGASPCCRASTSIAPSMIRARPSGAGATSSTRKRSAGPPTCRGSSTSRRRIGRPSTRTPGTSTRRSSTSPCGTSPCSSPSWAGSGRAIAVGPVRSLLVHRAVLGGPLRHREPAPGQLLGRGLPRRPARERRRHRRGRRRPRLDASAPGDGSPPGRARRAPGEGSHASAGPARPRGSPGHSADARALRLVHAGVGLHRMRRTRWRRCARSRTIWPARWSARPRHRHRARAPPAAVHRHPLAPRRRRHRRPHREGRGGHHGQDGRTAARGPPSSSAAIPAPTSRCYA